MKKNYNPSIDNAMTEDEIEEAMLYIDNSIHYIIRFEELYYNIINEVGYIKNLMVNIECYCKNNTKLMNAKNMPYT